ncbi:MAG: choice-of-anchor tandem repeat GloVer-containing protein, partial [Chitinophagaceae bacterium]
MKSKFLLACIFCSPILWAQQQLIGFNFGGGLNGNGNIFSINTNGTNYQIKASFPFAYGSGNSVQIADGYDGFYYGISFGDGYNDAGSIFKIRYNGTNYTVLRKLQRNIDGGSPRFKPVIAPDGFLYGVCEDGGLFRNGTIWKMAIDGSSFTVLKHFNVISEGTEGFFGSLTLGIDGLLYGVTGGNFGHLFSISTNGSRFTKLISFTGNGSIKGASPRTPLVQDAEGFLWGTTYGGGQNDKGTLFKFHPRTLVFSTIKQFTGSDGTRPSTSLLEIGNEMYGACDNEGQNGDNGTLWKINKNGNNFLVIKYLDVAFTGGRCSNSLYWHNDGFIYSSLQSYGPRNMGTIFKIQPNGNNFTVLRETHLGNGAANQLLFNQTNQQFYAVIMGGPSNGGALISYNNYFNTDKYIYGFNYYHEGAKPSGVPLVINNAASSQYGKVFGNTLTGYLNNGLLFSAYTQQNNQQHKIVLPYTSNFGYSSSTRFGLIMGSDGYLYGCMENGGGLVWGQSDGTVFRVNPADTTDKSIVKYFNNTNTNALQPIYLLEGTDGFLYGIARMGGNNNRGTIFKMNKDGSNYQNIYHTGGTNSLLSITSIIFDAVTQQLIGTGTNTNYEECIFTISNSGNNLTTIKTFVPANANMEGNDLQPTLTLVGDTLYGSMKRGGNSSLGSIFKINKNGSGFSVIYLFTATTIGNPLGALQIDENGFVYGTCSGSYNSTSAGSGIFKIHSSGHSFSILKQFSNNATDINGIIPGSVVLV